MILTLNEFDNDRDCPELYDAFNATPTDLVERIHSYGPKVADDMDAETLSLFLAYGNTTAD